MGSSTKPLTTIPDWQLRLKKYRVVSFFQSMTPKIVFRSLLVLSTGLLLGCATVTIEMDQNTLEHLDRQPDITQSVSFPWFGLAGKHEFDTKALCQGRPSVKIQAVHTLKDIFSGLKTGFFYLPKTAKVWCKLPALPNYPLPDSYEKSGY